jgi:broad specificity phosphatase PhoE
MEVYLVRHAESEGNRQRCGGGTYDWLLSEFGRRQAHALCNVDFAQSLTHIYSSPLTRARETAKILSENSKIPVEIDDRLIDVDAGELNGAAWVEIQDKYVDFFKSVPRNMLLPFPGGGETNRDIVERTRSFASSLRGRFSISPNQFDRNVVVAIVSHGLPLNYLVLHLLEHEPTGIECMYLRNAAVAHISFKLMYPILVSFNDIRHLERSGLINEMHNMSDVNEDRGPVG